jgi:hypothetical protein
MIKMNSNQLSCSLEGLDHISYLARANMNGIPPTPNSPCPPGHAVVAGVANATGAQLSPPLPPPPSWSPPSLPILHNRMEFPTLSHGIRTMCCSSRSAPPARCRAHRSCEPARHLPRRSPDVMSHPPVGRHHPLQSPPLIARCEESH